MKVAIYLDSHDAEHIACAKLCIDSVRRHMPFAEVWHLTVTDGPELPADKTLRLDVEGSFGYRRMFLHSKLEGDVLFIDDDILINDDVSHVFNEDFDIAVTTDIKPGMASIKYNSGVTFSRSPEFWALHAEKVKAMGFEWDRLEPEFTRTVDQTGFAVKILPGEVYNRVPKDEHDIDGKILHYRGPRKKWLLGTFAVNIVTTSSEGWDYVKILFDRMLKCCPVRFRFFVMTEDEHLDFDCIRGSKKDVFDHFQKEPTLFLAPDSIIVGSIEPLVKLKTGFAATYDEGLQPKVMFWRGKHSWDEEAEAIQDLLPGVVVWNSKFMDWPPVGSSVVCSYMNGKPKDLTDTWVGQFWKIGGIAQPNFIRGLNHPEEEMLKQAEENIKRDLPLFLGQPPHEGEAIIVGGGPSLTDTLPKLRFRRNRGGHVFALNGTHDWLIERGIIPDFMLMLDARPDNVCFVQHPHKDCTYLIAAQCHPSVFDALEGYHVIMWLGYMNGMEDLAGKYPDKPITIVGGGGTIGLKAMTFAHLWGYRKQHLFGFDSSYRGKDNHAYRQPLNDKEAQLPIFADGKEFRCARWMAKQAQDFQSLAKDLSKFGSQIIVHGDGLIPFIARKMNLHADNWRENGSGGRRRLDAVSARPAA